MPAGVMFARREILDALVFGEGQRCAGRQRQFLPFEDFRRRAARLFDVMDRIIDNELLSAARGRGELAGKGERITEGDAMRADGECSERDLRARARTDDRE